MRIGVPKEIKAHEYRVALSPAGGLELLKRGHEVVIETDAGLASGFTNEDYEQYGARVAHDAGAIWADADMILKVKEPLDTERPRIREGQIVFTYFHFAADRELTRAVIDSGGVAIAYETVEKADGTLPLLAPMSEVAGRMSVQEGAKYLEKAQGGRGILLAGIPGVRPASVLIVGGGVVGMNAARIAAGMGANVTILDINLQRLRYLSDILPANVTPLMSLEATVRELLPGVDIVIGALLIPGARAPRVITRDMLELMRPGAVIVDVAIDQGGCFETSKPTTHDDPIYTVDGVVHYCVANMPGAVPFTSTMGLTNATLPYAIEIADKGWRRACAENADIARGLNVAEGAVTYKAVAEFMESDWTPVEEILKN